MTQVDPTVEHREPARRVSAVTPLLEAWKVATAITAFGTWQGRELIQGTRMSWSVAIMAFLALMAVSIVISLFYNFLAWRRLSYGFDSESIYVHSGIIFRSQRHVRLNRVQAVNLSRPVLARIFGFVAVQVTSAGSGQDNLVIAYVRDSDGGRLRQEILYRAHGHAPGDVSMPAPAQHDVGYGSEVGDPTPSGLVEDQEVLRIKPGRIIGSLIRSTAMVVSTIVIALVITGAIAAKDPSLIVGMLVPAFAQGTFWWQRLNQQFDFTIGRAPGEIRLRYGLVSTVARTIPIDRVQAVGLVQPVLWRRKNWWRISLTVAGQDSSAESGHSLLAPVATQQEVESLLALVLPHIGVDEPQQVLNATLHGKGEHYGFTTSPLRARVIDPLVWRRTGFRFTPTMSLIRRGRITKRATLIPHTRIQSLSLSQGPLQRGLRLTNLAIDLTPGPVGASVPHLDSPTARQCVETLSRLAHDSRRQAKTQMRHTVRVEDGYSM